MKWRRFRYLFFVGLAILGLTLSTTHAHADRAQLQFQSGQSDMKITGSSTVHDWTCGEVTTRGYIAVDRSVVEDGTIELGTLASSLKDDEAGTPVTKLNVPVKKMHCSKDGMDPKMYKALKANDHPTIEFDLESVRVMDTSESETESLKLQSVGTLSIAGVERQIKMPVTVQNAGDTGLRVKGRKSMKMSDYDVEKPTAMWGTITAYDKVTVHFDMRATLRTNSERE
jgi:hypothetical protein